MKRFKSKKRSKNIDILLILLFFIILFNIYNNKLSPKINNIIESKIDEITTLYIKKDIMPEEIIIDKLMIINKNDKNEILYVDVDYDYAYKIMSNIVKKIQENMNNLKNGNDIYEKELKSYNDSLFIELPLFLYKEGSLLSNLGPKVPIKISFYEHVLGTITTEIKEYGINNALITVNLILDVEHKLNIPFETEKKKNSYNIVLGSKIINGVVPDVYGGLIKSNSNLMSYY